MLGGLLTDLLGFRTGLTIGGGLTALMAAVWLRVLPDLDGARRTRLTLRAVAPEPFPWRMALGVAIPMGVTRFVFAGVITATAILWLNGLVGDGLTVSGQVIPLATLTGALAALRALVSVAGARLAGHLSDGAGHRWLVTAGALLAGSLGIWLAASDRAPVAVAGALAAAVTAGGVQALTPALVGDRSPTVQRGRVLSVVYTLGDLGSALGPPLALGMMAWLPVGVIYRLCAALLGLTVVFALWQARGEHPKDVRLASS